MGNLTQWEVFILYTGRIMEPGDLGVRPHNVMVRPNNCHGATQVRPHNVNNVCLTPPGGQAEPQVFQKCLLELKVCLLFE